MNEEQRKPKWGLSELRLIMLFTILLLVVFAVCFLYIAFIDRPGPDKMPPYTVTNNELKNAFFSYVSAHNGSLPIFNGTYTNGECLDCNVINISAVLITNGGIVSRAPDGLYLSASGNDNCGGNASLGCSPHASYIWIVDAVGNVFSYCAGTGCTTNNSGYQDVWP